MALEPEALLLQRAVRAKVLDPDKGTAALYVYSQLRQKGAQFTFAEFLVSQGLITTMALNALEQKNQGLRAVSELGDYELVSLIGEGHNGVVFKALQKSLDRMVALKILSAQIANDPSSLERFQNEARATAKLTHPNVVMGIDVGSDQGLNYFAMEYVDGGSLRSMIEHYKGTIPESTALNLTRQVAEGLKAAHAVGLVHRDVKPDNILLTKDGQAKLADLGISQVLSSEKDAGDFWASPPYVAPEVIQGLAENDPRSDLYSLGATFFEMLAGQPPFVGDTPEEIMGMHLHQPVPDVRGLRGDVSEATAMLILRMLEKNPEERIPDAASVSSAISKILALNRPPVQAAPQGQPRGRRPAARSSPRAPAPGGRTRYGARRPRR